MSPIAFLTIGLIAVDGYVSLSTKERIYTEVAQVPEQPIALLLGTAKYYQGLPNLYYEYRIRAAVELFESGKVRAILVSGDNSEKNYNEPQEMKDDLIARGIPDEYITLDYAGFRTLDSIVRAKAIFGQSSLIVISQEFHCQRAIFIANNSGMTAFGYVAETVPLRWGFKVRSREILARFVAFLDVKILNRQPKFLGQKEEIRLKGKF